MMSKTLEAVWESCLNTIRQHVNQQSFKTWFEPIRPVKLDGQVLTIQVPSQFFYEWLEEHYVALLRRTITKELGAQARLEYQIVIDKPSIPDRQRSEQVHSKTRASNTSNNTPVNASTGLVQMSKGNGRSNDTIRNPFVIPGIKDINIESNLIDDYTFATYVEGECNQLARSAGVAIAKNPGGTAFNPLVIYGGVGLGKTHLAHAIGNEVKAKMPNKRILYVSSEKFTNQFIDAVRNGSINDFMHFYQLIDLLIVDDVQFFANKDRTQDIFFHTFNHLHQSGKQIILTSDRAPKDLEGMEERLLSRFKWGLTADLQVPDLETRIAILEKKLYADHMDIPRPVVEYVAYHISTNVREMEGALISLIAQSSLNNKEITMELAKNIVRKFVRDFSREVSIEVIQQTVSEYFKVPLETLKSKTRKRDVVQARQISMYLSKKFTENSLKVIGQHFGGRDHSTVIHACQAVLNLMETDRHFQDDVITLQKQLSMRM